jgi:hypothetical protein
MTKARDFWITLAVLVGSIFVLGLFLGSKAFANGIPPSKCPVYREALPPQIEGWKWTYAPAHPVGIKYARCVLRGVQ